MRIPDNQPLIGLVFPEEDTTGTRSRRHGALAPDSVHAGASLADGAGSVALTQTFTNTTGRMLVARYVLPLDEGAAVTAFEANVDGRIVTGVVKEAKAAKAEFDAAVAAGDGAFLAESKSAEHFEIALGNVEPRSVVSIKLTYVTMLRTQAGKFKFVLPGSLGGKYVTSSVGAGADASGTAELAGVVPLGLDVHWRMSPGIAEVDSPSHPDTVDAAVVNDDGTFVSFSLALDSFKSDFILQMVPVASPAPMLLIEEREVAPGVSTKAAVVSFTPDLVPSTSRAQIFFVVDRSGSMGGARMEQAKKALQLFLRSLPEDCMFSIVGFGTSFDYAFGSSPEPVEYTDETLSTATAHVHNMTANLGGTEILQPLARIFALPPPDPEFSRQIFVLTDGQVSNTNEVIKSISKAVAGASTPTRVFTLGLGAGASRALVNGMARAGRGTAFFVDDDDTTELSGTVIRQLKQALQPGIPDLVLEWTSVDGDVEVTNVGPRLPGGPIPVVKSSSSKKKKLPMTRAVGKGAVKAAGKVMGGLRGAARKVAGSGSGASSSAGPSGGDETASRMPGGGVVQAPHFAPPVFNGERFVVFAFFKPEFGVPARVELKGSSDAGPLSFDISLESLPVIQGNTIHSLAARALIRDLEEGTSFMHTMARGDAAISAEIVRLGKAFQLASTKTSFIGVEKRTNGDEGGEEVMLAPPPPPAPTTVLSRPTGGMRKKKMAKKGRSRLAMSRSSARGGGGGGGRGGRRARGKGAKRDSAISRGMAAPKSRRSAGPPPAPARARNSAPPPPGAFMMQSSSLAESAMKEKVDLDILGDCMEAEEDDCDEMCAAVADFSSDESFDGGLGASTSPAVIDYDAAILNIVLTQSVKGKFGQAALSHIGAFGTKTKPDAFASVSDEAWVTALVVAFFQSSDLESYRSQWELVVEKALKWLRSEVEDADALVGAAGQ